MKEAGMARFDGTGTLEELFDDAPQAQRAAVRADVEVGADRPNVFRANWHELAEARADEARLDRFASEWDLMADRARAAALRVVPDASTILARLLTRRNKKAAGRAAMAVVEGIGFRREGDALIVASQSEARDWTVTAHGCNCRARGECFHGELYAVTVGWEAQK
jgi:hypothetical protein